MRGFDAKEYWENRLKMDFSLRGSGFSGLGKWYNYWMYRIRRRVFLKVVRSLRLDLAIASVLDVGSGTGFYLNRWKEIGVSKISGLDFSDTAIRELRLRYPTYKFFRMDIGDSTVPIDGMSFDAISAFDVLFHIIDDRRFERSIRNIVYLLKPDGVLIFSDNYLHNGPIRAQHQVCRSLQYIESKLLANGLKIVGRVPMFYLMNVPFDSNSLILKIYWRIVAAAVSRSEFLGFVIGAITFPIELWCVSFFRESPTTELMICRKTNKA